MGDFYAHLDGQASDFCPTAAAGSGASLGRGLPPMQARWDVWKARGGATMLLP